MSFSRQKGAGNFKPVAKGPQVGVIYLLADLGKQANTLDPTKEPAFQLAVGVQFPSQLSTSGEPLTIIRMMTSSMHPKANWRKWVDTLKGIDFRTQEEADAFPYDEMIGAGGLFNIVHRTKGEKTYANIDGIMPLVDGMPVPAVKGEPIIYTLNLVGAEASKAYERLPAFVQAKISNRLITATERAFTEEETEIEFAA